MKPHPFCLLIFALAATALAPTSVQAYYNPTTGRWLSRDPVAESGFKQQDLKRTATLQPIEGTTTVTPGLPGYPNPFSFTSNDPENSVDILGLRDCPAWAEYLADHPASKETQDLMELEAALIGLFTPWPGDEGTLGVALGKRLEGCVKQCSKIRCVVRWHGKHHSFAGVKKCHLELQCYRKGVKAKPNKIYVPLPDWLCPPWK